MIKYIDESYYEINFSSNIPDNFEQLNIEASMYIKNRTHNRVDIKNIPEEVKYTTCLLINLINKEKNEISELGNLKSQSNDGVSETYMSVSEIETNYENMKISILSEYLTGVMGKDRKPLLYLGVC